MDARTNAGETSDCDLVYVWVQKASALLAWWRKVQNVELTLAKARVYNATSEFDISSLIRLEERFYALLKKRVGILATDLAIEESPDGCISVDGIRRVAMISPFIAIPNGFAQVIQDIVNDLTLSVGVSSFDVVTIEIEIAHAS